MLNSIDQSTGFVAWLARTVTAPISYLRRALGRLGTQNQRIDVPQSDPVRVSDNNVPEGMEYLKLIGRIEDECESFTLTQIPKLGTKAARCYPAIGTCLSLLDRAASCWWQCRGGDHVLEYIVGRATMVARASLRLSKMGLYDEALALNRNLGEIANLLCLFASDISTMENWKAATEKERRNQFSPVKVRRALENLNTPMRIDDTRYGNLSGLATHVTPDTAPQRHNQIGLPVLAAKFQQAGFLLCLNEVALPLVFITYAMAQLFDLEKEVKLTILEAGRELIDATGAVTIDRIDEMWEFMASHDQQQDEARAR